MVQFCVLNEKIDFFFFEKNRPLKFDDILPHGLKESQRSLQFAKNLPLKKNVAPKSAAGPCPQRGGHAGTTLGHHLLFEGGNQLSTAAWRASY